MSYFLCFVTKERKLPPSLSSSLFHVKIKSKTSKVLLFLNVTVCLSISRSMTMSLQVLVRWRKQWRQTVHFLQLGLKFSRYNDSCHKVSRLEKYHSDILFRDWNKTTNPNVRPRLRNRTVTVQCLSSLIVTRRYETHRDCLVTRLRFV